MDCHQLYLAVAGRFFIKLVFNLGLAWLVVSVLSRIIRSRQLSSWVAMVAWLIVALNLTGYLTPTAQALDSLAFSIGEVRLSALLLIKTVALLVGLTWLATNTGNFVETRIKQMSDLTPSLQVLMGKFVKIFLVIMAIIVALNSVGMDLTVFAGIFRCDWRWPRVWPAKSGLQLHFGRHYSAR